MSGPISSALTTYDEDKPGDPVTDARLRVSIVIPVYNEEDMIEPCLDAILRQTVAADEIIVVDNDSTDATSDRLDAYRGRVTVLREPRRGVLYARNTGLDRAAGELIGRIDADTRLPPRWVEHLHEIFADRAVAAVTGPARYYDIRLPRLISRLDLLLRSTWARVAKQRLDWSYGANMAIRASAWQAVRGALCDDREIHEDVDLGIHLFHAGYWVIFAPELAAGTSSRRIRDSRCQFRAYLRMTEHCFATHAALASGNSYRQARLTNRLILLCYYPLRFLHLTHGSGPPLRSLREWWASAVTRKNPMSGA
jgi:glycosyltransferase involved in cell wall biosynthesis